MRPVKILALPENEAGVAEKNRNAYEKFLERWESSTKHISLNGLYENVKGMLSSNGGLNYLAIISKMDELGYDCEWQNINSKWYVSQNMERIYTIGHN